MFSYCSSLTSLNLSNFNTNNVTNMSYMFNICSSLTTLNLYNFTINENANICYMFSGINISCNLICNNSVIRNQFKN